MPENTSKLSIPYPIPEDDPNVPGDMLALVNAIEYRLVGAYLTSTDRNNRNPSPVVGQFAVLKDDPIRVTMYTGPTDGWKQIWPSTDVLITSGTTVPANGSGTNGDVFLKV